MNRCSLAGAIIILLFTISSCKKEEINNTQVGSLTIANTVVGGATLKLGNLAGTAPNNSFLQVNINAGENDLYVWPVGDSLHPYYTNPKFNIEPQGIYSLFLTGTPSAVESIFIKDNIPYRTDSSVGVRVINLSPNTISKPLNITLAASPTVNEISNLAYKQCTNEFKSYPALINSSYVFQIRNDTCASPKAPLATYTAFTSTAIPRFANVTLVIRQNGATGVSVLRILNDR